MLKYTIALALVSLVACQECNLPNCFNPGAVSPIPSEKTPQFVMLSHDDEINKVTFEAFQKIDRCNMPITFFLMWSNIDCDYVKSFYNAGHEIALHTTNHLHLPAVPLDELKYETLGVRDLVHEKCGIPKEVMKGFRAPFLETNEHVRKVLFDDEYVKWDSTFNEQYKLNIPDKNQMWPFTMDSGLVKNSSMKDEKYPGVWEIPLNPFKSPLFPGKYSMDPGRITQDSTANPTDGVFLDPESMMELLFDNFESVYNSTRTPFSINFHTPWMRVPGYAEALSEFLNYAKTLDDVYFVTYSQLLEWMANPVPIEQMPPKNTECVPESPPTESFFDKYKTWFIVGIIVIGPVVVISLLVLIAQIIYLIKKKFSN